MSQHFQSRLKLHLAFRRRWRQGRAIASLSAVVLLTACTGQSSVSNGNASPNPTASAAVLNPTVTPSSESTTKSQATKDLETRLAKAFTDATQVPLDAVDCPAQFDVKAGNRFNCQAVSGGQPFTIAVELTNPEGQFKWSTQGLLLLSKLEQFIQTRVRAKGGPDVTADCGGKIRVAQPGDTFECKVTGAQAQSRSAQVKVKDAQGSVDISLR